MCYNPILNFFYKVFRLGTTQRMMKRSTVLVFAVAMVVGWGNVSGAQGVSRGKQPGPVLRTAQNKPDASPRRRDLRTGFASRFAKGTTLWGANAGFGFTFDLPSTHPGAPDRTNMDFLFFFPHFKYNLTGPIGDSFYRGALYWVVEAGAAVTFQDSDRLFADGVRRTVDQAPKFQLGFVPIQGEYKFLSPARRWAPYVQVGAGFSWGDFNDGAVEISTKFEFILNAGAGVEFFLSENRSVALGYRLWHLSNSNIERPNIGLNAHVFTVGFSF